MRKVTIHKHGIAWRLASYYGSLDEWDRETDICSYWRQVLKGVFHVFLVILVGACAGVAVGDFLAWGAAMITADMLIMPNVPALILAVMLALIGTISAAAGIWHLKTKRGWHAPVVLVEAYTSWKDKTCVKVELV